MSVTGTSQRQRTPLSPSPSPEPPEGAASRAYDNDTQGRLQAVTSQDNDGQHRRDLQLDPARTNDAAAAHAHHVSEQDSSAAVDVAQETARKTLEDRIRLAIDDLMQLATYAAEVQQGDEDIVGLKLNETMESLQALQDSTNVADLRHLVPEDVMDMIDAGRNPDIHTRTLTNRLNSDNQQMRGQAQNFNLYRNRLRDKMGQAFPEMQDDLKKLDNPSS